MFKPSVLLVRILDGLFDRVEAQCRGRWLDAFGWMSDEDDTARAA